MPPIPRRRRPLVPDEDVPWVDGTTEPATGTIAATERPIPAWPGSIIGRLSFTRRLLRGRRSRAEDDHVRRLTTIAAARDVGECAPTHQTEDGRVVVDPPHRGIGRLRLTRSVEQRTPALSRALTQAANAGERVIVAQGQAKQARQDVDAARRAMPARPRIGDIGRPVLVALVLAFAAIEGIATRPLWAEVTDDKRLGLVFAVVFAVVFTAAVHILATWLWSLADSLGWQRNVTLAIVAGMLVTAGGLLFVAGFERDRILISNLAQERAARATRDQGTVAGQSLINGTVPATDAGAAAKASQPTGGAGLLGALGGSSAPASGTATSGPSPAGGGLAGAVPGSTVAGAPVRTRRAGGVDDTDDVSFHFVIWLNILVLFAMLLFARGRAGSSEYRRAAEHLQKLENRDESARAKLQVAEERRQDATAGIDFAERVLYPLAQRCTAEERELDRLFVDQVQRSAVAAGHGRVRVELASEPEDLIAALEEMLSAELPTLTPAGVQLGAMPVEHEDLVAGIVGSPATYTEPPLASPFESAEPTPSAAPQQPGTASEPDVGVSADPEPETEQRHAAGDPPARDHEWPAHETPLDWANPGGTVRSDPPIPRPSTPDLVPPHLVRDQDRTEHMNAFEDPTASPRQDEAELATGVPSKPTADAPPNLPINRRRDQDQPSPPDIGPDGPTEPRAHGAPAGEGIDGDDFDLGELMVEDDLGSELVGSAGWPRDAS